MKFIQPRDAGRVNAAPLAHSAREAGTVPDNLRSALRLIAKVAFGIVQLLLIARIVLLLFAPSLADPTANGYLQLTQPLVDPFIGLSQGELVDQFSGSILDIYAIFAFVGYTILELTILWIIGWEFRPHEPMPPPLPKAAPADEDDRTPA